jgi:hypothetical protein
MAFTNNGWGIMKQHQLIVILGCLLLSTNSFAEVVSSSLVVSGSNDPLVNGTYTLDIAVNGKGSWIKGDYVLSWSNVLMGDSWNITNSSSAAVYYYYDDWSDTAVPSESGWSCLLQKVSPCTPPVVTQTTLPDTLIVSGTADSFLNGTYARGLNDNSGFPRYANGDYEICQGLIPMISVWSIEDKGTGNQYYTHPSIGATVPEYGWASGPYGNVATPPVVTEIELPNQYQVSGAGFSDVNGIYTRTVNSNSHTGLVYEKEAIYFLGAGGFGLMELGYGITNSGGGSYYYVASDSLVIPSPGWTLDFLGASSSPPPFVRPYSFPWSLFVPSITKNVTP